MIIGFKGIDKHVIYAQVALIVVAIFIFSYGIASFCLRASNSQYLSLDVWHTKGPTLTIYEKGILTKDPGTTYIFQTTFQLDHIFTIKDPTFFIKEGFIPSQVFINGRAISITNISKGHHPFTYNISYTIPPSSLTYENTLKIVYTTGDRAGWLADALIVPKDYVKQYMFLHSTIQFVANESITIVSTIAFFSLLLIYIYSKYQYIVFLSEISLLIFFISVLSASGIEEKSLIYFIPLAIGTLILQQITYTRKRTIFLLIEVAIVGISLLLPLIITHHEYSYPIARMILTFPLLIITISNIQQISTQLLPVLYWLIVLFSTLIGESFIQAIIPTNSVSTTASLITSTASILIFALFGLYTETLFTHREHPANFITTLISNETPFASIFIRSSKLAKEPSLTEKLIVPELYGKDTYTINEKGIWIIRPNITDDEIILWSSKLAEKLRDIEGIKDIRIGILMFYPNEDKKISVRKIFKETVELAENARYPEFINFKSSL
ncbi:hypothetical protein [Zhurongbacter thermophilus]